MTDPKHSEDDNRTGIAKSVRRKTAKAERDAAQARKKKKAKRVRGQPDE